MLVKLKVRDIANNYIQKDKPAKTSLELFRHYSNNKLLKDFPKTFMDMKDG